MVVYCYAEELAKKVFDIDCGLDTDDSIVDVGYPIAVQDLGKVRARALFNRYVNEDFTADFVSNYYCLRDTGAK